MFTFILKILENACEWLLRLPVSHVHKYIFLAEFLFCSEENLNNFFNREFYKISEITVSILRFSFNRGFSRVLV